MLKYHIRTFARSTLLCYPSSTTRKVSRNLLPDPAHKLFFKHPSLSTARTQTNYYHKHFLTFLEIKNGGIQ